MLFSYDLFDSFESFGGVEEWGNGGDGAELFDSASVLGDNKNNFLLNGCGVEAKDGLIVFDDLLSHLEGKYINNRDVGLHGSEYSGYLGILFLF